MRDKTGSNTDGHSHLYAKEERRVDVSHLFLFIGYLKAHYLCRYEDHREYVRNRRTNGMHEESAERETPEKRDAYGLVFSIAILYFSRHFPFSCFSHVRPIWSARLLGNSFGSEAKVGAVHSMSSQ